MKTKPFLLALLCAFLPNPWLFGQAGSDSLEIGVRPYGSFRGHFAFYNDEIEIQENASRIGLELSVTKGQARFFAASEVGINLFRSNVQFNADASSEGGFVVFERSQANQVFTTRLGYLGVDLGRYGRLSVGKQWSVYYDVTGFTDKFNVYGGQASATYAGGTDGGTTATGRADQSVIYRNRWGPFQLGGQLQFRTVTNNRLIDGVALSGRYTPLTGLTFGMAYVENFYNQALKDMTIGFGDDPTYLSVGGAFRNDRIELGLVYVSQRNGDVVESFIDLTEDAAVIFNAQGIEAFARIKLLPMTIIAGYNGYFPDVDDLPVNQAFQREFYILGLEYRPNKLAYLYAEYRVGNGKNHLGSDYFDVLTMGLRVNLERSWSKMILPK